MYNEGRMFQLEEVERSCFDTFSDGSVTTATAIADAVLPK